MGLSPVLAVIPARGGSKGFPRKNIAELAGLPLIVHSIRFAAMCPEISECIVSTDSDEIAAVASAHGGVVPFRRPAELAQDETPTWPVLRHALAAMETLRKKQFGSVLLLQPTDPARLPEDVTRALEILNSDRRAVGVASVSEPSFNPRWLGVEEREGYLARAFSDKSFTRRQDVPPVYRINGLIYLWRREHVLRAESDPWSAPHKMMIVPEARSIDIDTPHELAVAEALVHAGVIQLPWLASKRN